MLSHRYRKIKPSPTLAMVAKANDMKSRGIDVINLSAGEPDFDTPEFIKDAARQALADGKTKYTAADGMKELKQAVQAKLQRDNGLSYDLSEIMIANGGKQVIFNAFMATLNPGDEVIVPSPYWVSYPDIALLFDGVPKTVLCNSDVNFKLTPDLLRATITPQTKWLVLNSPSNPTGTVYSESELMALAQVLREHPHVYVMSDDIYEYLIYDGIRFFNLAMVAPDLKERILIVNGVSKSCSMTGWRIGYGAGPKTLIKAMGALQSQSTSNACSISQIAAIAAINGPHDFLPEWCETFMKRRELCLEILGHTPLLDLMMPKGAFYLYIGCQDLLGKTTPEGQILNNDDDVCQYLLDSAQVAVVAGSGFGMSPYFRISYAANRDILMQGCHRIIEAIERLR